MQQPSDSLKSSSVPPALLTVAEAAALAGRPEPQFPKRLYRWAAQGQIPGVRRIGRAIYIVRAEFDAWLGLDGHEKDVQP
jgi:hypothetical protein